MEVFIVAELKVLASALNALIAKLEGNATEVPAATPEAEAPAAEPQAEAPNV